MQEHEAQLSIMQNQIQHLHEELHNPMERKHWKKPTPPYGVKKTLISESIGMRMRVKVMPDAYGCDGIIPPGKTGEVHITENNWPSYEAYRDAQAMEVFANGFNTMYIPMGDGVPLFSGVHKDMSHTLTWKQRFVNWWRLMVR